MIQGEQFELFNQPARDRAGEDARALLAALAEAAEPIPGRKLRAALGWSEKRLRDAANATRGRVLSGPGLAGYILLKRASTELAEHTFSAFASQVRAMRSRLSDYYRCYYPSGKAPPLP